MERVHISIHPGWFKLTKKGAKIVLGWHKMGIRCIDYRIEAMPEFGILRYL
jgi:hypothetical protein